jgi:hypothetical protein
MQIAMCRKTGSYTDAFRLDGKEMRHIGKLKEIISHQSSTIQPILSPTHAEASTAVPTVDVGSASSSALDLVAGAVKAGSANAGGAAFSAALSAAFPTSAADALPGISRFGSSFGSGCAPCSSTADCLRCSSSSRWTGFC